MLCIQLRSVARCKKLSRLMFGSNFLRYSTSTASIVKGARGYVGRDFQSALDVLASCQAKSASLAEASALLKQALSNFGEFLNSHYIFQLLHYSTAYVASSKPKCCMMIYFSLWCVVPMPKPLISSRSPSSSPTRPALPVPLLLAEP